ncbi:hypothetical protein V8E36_001985 [Tilletia maclaganii]
MLNNRRFVGIIEIADGFFFPLLLEPTFLIPDFRAAFAVLLQIASPVCLLLHFDVVPQRIDSSLPFPFLPFPSLLPPPPPSSSLLLSSLLQRPRQRLLDFAPCPRAFARRRPLSSESTGSLSQGNLPALLHLVPSFARERLAEGPESRCRGFPCLATRGRNGARAKRGNSARKGGKVSLSIFGILHFDRWVCSFSVELEGPLHSEWVGRPGALSWTLHP